jgi:hypothetical protein
MNETIRTLGSDIEIISIITSLDGSPFELLSNPTMDGHKLGAAAWAAVEKQVYSLKFVPHLLILIASPLYHESGATPLLRHGINAEFSRAGYPELPMIVSSYSETIFGPKLKRSGAILICVASRARDVADEAALVRSDAGEAALLGLPS